MFDPGSDRPIVTFANLRWCGPECALERSHRVKRRLRDIEIDRFTDDRGEAHHSRSGDPVESPALPRMQLDLRARDRHAARYTPRSRIGSAARAQPPDLPSQRRAASRRRVVRRGLVENAVQTGANAQRISGAPRDHSLRFQRFTVAEPQRPAVPARCPSADPSCAPTLSLAVSGRVRSQLPFRQCRTQERSRRSLEQRTFTMGR